MVDSDMYLLIDMFLTLAASVRASHICFNTMSPFCDLHDDDLFYPDLSMIYTHSQCVWLSCVFILLDQQPS